MQSVTFINCFIVPDGEEEEFLTLWREINGYAQSKPGYIGHTLHRALQQPPAKYQFVNVAVWQSQEHFQAATDAHFRELLRQPGWARFQSVPALYQVMDQKIPAQGAVT